MKRLISTLAVAAAFAGGAAYAENEMDADASVDATADVEAGTEADVDERDFIAKSTTHVPGTSLDANKAAQAFLAIDTENDGLLTKAEWADWQNTSDESLNAFADFDADGDGDIEFSEYLANWDG